MKESDQKVVKATLAIQAEKHEVESVEGHMSTTMREEV